MIPCTRLFVLSAAFCVACSSTGEPGESDWGSGSPEQLAQSSKVSAEASPAPAPKGPVTTADIVNWGLWKSVCGTEPSPLPDPNKVMERLVPEERALAIYTVLMQEPLSSPRVDGLVSLIAFTQDEKAISYITDVFDAAQTIAERRVAAQILGQDPEMRASFTATEATANRTASVNSVAEFPGPEADTFLAHAAQSTDATASGAAIRLLEERAQ